MFRVCCGPCERVCAGFAVVQWCVLRALACVHACVCVQPTYHDKASHTADNRREGQARKNHLRGHFVTNGRKFPRRYLIVIGSALILPPQHETVTPVKVSIRL